MKKLLLACALTVSLLLSNESSGAKGVTDVAVPAAVTKLCNVADLPCLHRVLLDKNDEVLSLGRRLGFREQEIKVLQDALNIIVEQRDLAAASTNSLLKAANNLIPHWYDSPLLWFAVGTLSGILLTVLAGWAIGQVIPHGVAR